MAWKSSSCSPADPPPQADFLAGWRVWADCKSRAVHSMINYSLPIKVSVLLNGWIQYFFLSNALQSVGEVHFIVVFFSLIKFHTCIFKAALDLEVFSKTFSSFLSRDSQYYINKRFRCNNIMQCTWFNQIQFCHYVFTQCRSKPVWLPCLLKNTKEDNFINIQIQYRPSITHFNNWERQQQASMSGLLIIPLH